ncbi:VCBS repeat-containing protein [Flavobacterium sp. J372]|uniref:FG-GAP repeat domain-containing protein n=1 Tax=Flavobacterium sp. J372 TaxID=2898436 RepID=UPI0021507180|nr:VCBS repeat-containing protein [Flavobacterium sp. J372]MCR5860679.1 VCBS repeat-containing protein [Flavobacterium sp. J372]
MAFNSEVNITSAVFDPNKADTGDIDGDGYIDIVVSSGTDKKITWYKNNNGQGFTGNQNIVTSSLNGACNATLVDIDNDGDLDIMANSTYLVQGNYTSLFCYKNNGQGIFTQQLITPEEFGNPAYSYNYVDVDSDG